VDDEIGDPTLRWILFGVFAAVSVVCLVGNCVASVQRVRGTYAEGRHLFPVPAVGAIAALAAIAASPRREGAIPAVLLLLTLSDLPFLAAGMIVSARGRDGPLP